MRAAHDDRGSGIVDAHHHLWERPYAWMAGAYDVLRRPYRIEDLHTAATGLGVTATVAIQADTTEHETRELLAEDVDAVVGWVDLTAPDVADRLAALRHPRLVGIRHTVQSEPDPAWLGRAGVRRGLRAVAAAGLRYDLLVFPHQLPAAIRLARELPELPLVLDHGAKPPIADGGWEPWSSDLGALAACEQVHCKLSGLVTEASWDGWHGQVGRYADRLLEAFGPRRLMFGSDWPVCTVAASYAEVLEVARAAVAGLSEHERADVLGGTARRFYGIDVAD
jgi:L-fuconolactonase